jgi:hypothetical protein
MTIHHILAASPGREHAILHRAVGLVIGATDMAHVVLPVVERHELGHAHLDDDAVVVCMRVTVHEVCSWQQQAAAVQVTTCQQQGASCKLPSRKIFNVHTSLTSSGSLMSTMGYRPKKILQIGPNSFAYSGSATCMPSFICQHQIIRTISCLHLQMTEASRIKTRAHVVVLRTAHGTLGAMQSSTASRDPNVSLHTRSSRNTMVTVVMSCAPAAGCRTTTEVGVLVYGGAAIWLAGSGHTETPAGMQHAYSMNS